MKSGSSQAGNSGVLLLSTAESQYLGKSGDAELVTGAAKKAGNGVTGGSMNLEAGNGVLGGGNMLISGGDRVSDLGGSVKVISGYARDTS